MAVAVMEVRPVAVGVLRLLVGMLVAVGPACRAAMIMTMMAVVVAMGVGMDQGRMTVEMDVPLPEDGRRPEDHESRSRGHRPGRTVAENRQGSQGADERGGAENGAGAESAQSRQSPDIEDEAQTVSQSSDDKGVGQARPGRNPLSERDGQKQRERPGDKALDLGDPDGILPRDRPGEVIVESPGRHGRENEEGAAPDKGPRGRVPAQENACARHDRQGEPQAAAGVFMKKDNGDHGRGRGFKVEKEGGRDSPETNQSEEEADRADHAASDDGSGEPGQVPRRQSSGFRFLPPGKATAEVEDRQAQEGAQIQPSGQDQGRNVAEKELSQGGAKPEKDGRKDGREVGASAHEITSLS